MLKGFNSIGDLQMYWQICEQTYLQSEHRQHYQDLVEPLAKLYSYIIEYQARAICHLSKAQLSRAWDNVTNSNPWAGKMDEIDAQDKACRGCIDPLRAKEIRKYRDDQLQVMQGSQIILDEIRRILAESGVQIQKNYEDQIERDLLRDLVSAFADPPRDKSPSESVELSVEAYKDFNQPRVPDMCEWFFKDDTFGKWRDSNTTSLLWVSAGPGCGKSVLSRALIDEGRLSTRVTTSTICYFFFKNGYERRMHSTSALCAILHQLFIRDLSGSLIKNALTSHKNFQKSLTGNFAELWKILESCVDSPDAGEIVCLVDALDECDETSSEKLVSKLRNYYCQAQPPSKPSSKLKFLITSRPYNYLEAYFDKFPATSYLRFEGDEKSEDIGREIDLVIESKVNDLPKGFDSVRSEISEGLKSMKNRTYLWLVLTFDIIRKKRG